MISSRLVVVNYSYHLSRIRGVLEILVIISAVFRDFYGNHGFLNLIMQPACIHKTLLAAVLPHGYYAVDCVLFI